MAGSSGASASPASSCAAAALRHPREALLAAAWPEARRAWTRQKCWPGVGPCLPLRARPLRGRAANPACSRLRGRGAPGGDGASCGLAPELPGRRRRPPRARRAGGGRPQPGGRRRRGRVGQAGGRLSAGLRGPCCCTQRAGAGWGKLELECRAPAELSFCCVPGEPSCFEARKAFWSSTVCQEPVARGLRLLPQSVGVVLHVHSRECHRDSLPGLASCSWAACPAGPARRSASQAGAALLLVPRYKQALRLCSPSSVL